MPEKAHRTGVTQPQPSGPLLGFTSSSPPASRGRHDSLTIARNRRRRCSSASAQPQRHLHNTDAVRYIRHGHLHLIVPADVVALSLLLQLGRRTRTPARRSVSEAVDHLVANAGNRVDGIEVYLYGSSMYSAAGEATRSRQRSSPGRTILSIWSEEPAIEKPMRSSSGAQDAAKAPNSLFLPSTDGPPLVTLRQSNSMGFIG